MKKIELLFDLDDANRLSNEELSYQLNMRLTLEDVLKNPIEIWERDNKRFYFKAFNNGSFMVVVKNSIFNAMYEISNKDADANRYGELIYSKE